MSRVISERAQNIEIFDMAIYISIHWYVLDRRYVATSTARRDSPVENEMYRGVLLSRRLSFRMAFE